MANNYYTPTQFTKHTLARAENVNSEMGAIEAGFEKLPEEAELNEDRTTYQATDTGTANAYAIALSNTITAYTAGLRVAFVPANANTGAATLNVDGVGAVAIKNQDGTDLASGDILTTAVPEFRHNGTNFILLTVPGTTVAGAATQVGYAQEWATTAEDTPVSTAAGGDGATDFSALHWAAKTAADAVLTAADVGLTNADVVSAEAARALADAARVLAEAAQTAAEAAANGIYWKDPVACVATSNITLSGEQTVDDVTTSADRVLVTANTDASENGVYVSSAGAWSRAAPLDTWDEHVGAALNVIGGTVYDNSEWLCTVSEGGTLETTDITWIQRPAGDMKKSENLSGLASASTSFDNIKQAATDSATGVVELATGAEVATGTDTGRAVTPAGAASHYSPITRDTNDDTSTALTLALTDAGDIVFMSNAAANILTIPTNATVAFPVGTQIDVMMEGAGTTSITADTGVTLNGASAGSGDIGAQYGAVTLIKRATDTWVVTGNIGDVA